MVLHQNGPKGCINLRLHVHRTSVVLAFLDAHLQSSDHLLQLLLDLLNLGNLSRKKMNNQNKTKIGEWTA